MTWLYVTVIENNMTKPMVKFNMDRVVSITPKRNEGCLLSLDNGKEIFVSELLTFFNKLDNPKNEIVPVATTVAPVVVPTKVSPPPSESDLVAQIATVLKNQLKGPNSELKSRIKFMIKEIINENITDGAVVTEPKEEIAPQPIRKISNTTSNLGL